MANDITAERARALFEYDPDTGLLFWLSGPRNGSAAGCLRSDGYIYVKVAGVMIGAHRIAWVHYHGAPFKNEGDHKDRDRSNNAIGNLRDATPTQNRANAKIRSTNKTGFKGVCFDRRAGKYRADIRANGKRKTLGYFDNPEIAAAHYNQAASAAHGPFALVAKGEGLK